MWIVQESSSRQARFAHVEGCDKCDAPGDRMALRSRVEIRAEKDVVKRVLELDRVWEKEPIEI